jgi:hypothetical protein
MSGPGPVPAALLCAFLAGCGSSAAFTLTLDGRVVEFDCENQGVHLDAVPQVRDLPAGGGPGNRMMGLDPGTNAVAWLTHFENDVDALRDADTLYTVAVVLKERAPGTYDLPADGASVHFFCNNWGGGFRVCSARSTAGWLRVDEAKERALRGEFEVTLRGYRERPDLSREDATLRLRGRFDARR